jgi:uncharacterized protein (TIGR01777 family)
MHVLVAGASGLVGRALTPRLAADGHRVTRLIRTEGPPGGPTRFWDPDAGRLEAHVLEDVDAVVHLGGVSVGSLWTQRRKAAIRNSRVRSTRLLADAISNASKKPSVFIHASAVGYYGDRGDEVLTETSTPGRGFLADLCRDWEAASAPARDAGVRVVHVRTGLALTPRGGVLRSMLPAFRLGLGGRLGSGRQWMPWIGLEDLVDVYVGALADDSLRGAVNAVAPEQVTNADFTRALGRALKRPTFLNAPKFALRMLPGRMGKEALLASTRVLPEVLMRIRFRFHQPTLAGALAAL